MHAPAAPQVGVAPVQVEHVPPAEPQAAFAVPARQIPRSVSQQPPLHGVCVTPPQSALQTWVVVLHAVSAGQSVAELHPHAPVCATHAEPVRLPVQSTQDPELPHWVMLVPGAHEPFAPQQPAAHAAFAEQVSVQSPVARLQPALVEGHSAFVVQPHWPPPATASQVLPLVPAPKVVLQSEQRPPLFPHTAALVPARHVPFAAAEQQPPLQVWVELHAVVHVLLVGSQAWPEGQSAAVRQPHLLGADVAPAAPGMHADPPVAPVHATHAP